MNKKVYGLLGVTAVRSNYNADFSSHPRTSATGEFIATDKTFKYACRKYWTLDKEKVLAFSNLNDNLNPMTLQEKYEYLFNTTIDKKTTKPIDVLSNLFSCLDVLNFGATFAISKLNFSINGAVQIQQGKNVYEYAKAEKLSLLTPYRNPKDKDDGSEKGRTTTAEQHILDRAEFIYPFSINPENYDEYVGLVPNFNGYTEDAYIKFKEAARVGVTSLNTCSKAGCENNFALFIELKDSSKAYLPNLSSYLKYDFDSINIFDLTNIFTELLEEIKEEVEKVEVYYNKYLSDIVIPNTDIKVERRNILTGKEMI
ncbi:type I CRISPR-associated protein Cas7 [Clostridium botulinum]|uniref:Iron transporter n=2 Tax=Clostridium TaxID=1485 RepID=A0A1J1CR34_CLOSG|nr:MULTISPECIES: type I CRISPR-associated protein Cas7 [Clostridium]AJD29328.1 hypothetical protein T258_3994 [Clostridium botulinum Prevot_594]AJE13382.1 hypothetical protein T259_4185 [Clostridium botulinum CDC_1436]APF25103.1 hypothetical protein NPD7_4038 [Clostridium sporogenes]APH17010.1 hypothetical protein NPD5_3817 [Clostridium sporogenes]NCI20677.1 type I CRISPR-associated protein Cas7 [Clostridium botulinum]